MTFQSILFKKTIDGRIEETLEAPTFFVDLNLDQIIDTITTGKNEYNLKPFFYSPLSNIDAIKYRHEIFVELENVSLLEHIQAFARKMREMREHLTRGEKLYYKYQKGRWFLEAVEIYCDAVNSLAQDIASVDMKSAGFLGFHDYLDNYVKSPRFKTLLAETKKLLADLSSVKYHLLLRDNSIKVSTYETEVDYSAEVEKTFEKFKQGAVKDYRVRFSESLDMNHIEAQILDSVAKLYEDIFSSLDSFCTKNGNYLDKTIGLFDREIEFYVAYLEFTAPISETNLRFCIPHVSNETKSIFAYDTFDLALAWKLHGGEPSIVTNDFYLKGTERVIVVSGPNQGGKTTFARTFGQMHYLASLGCPVPGREAQLFLFDRLFTHFEKEEDIRNLRGKLQDDLVRMHAILDQATPNSLIIMNEIFTSTALEDAVFLSKNIMEKIIQLDLLCVCVTFIDELASFSAKTVSMVSMVDPENPALRTYKIVRRDADGLSYAVTIAEKYRLTYDLLKERIKL